MTKLIEELMYLYYAVCDPKYFGKVNSNEGITVEGLKIPVATEGIKQRQNEPISFIVFAKSDKEFEFFLKKTGWYGSDPVNCINSIKGAICCLFNLPYNRFQLTPYFWNGKTQDFNIQKPTKEKTVRKRHHARFWKTSLQANSGYRAYVGMASYDKGMKFFSHTIDPDIDKEREYLFDEFKKTDLVKKFKKMKMAGKMNKSIFNGDHFYTDGLGYLIYV